MDQDARRMVEKRRAENKEKYPNLYSAKEVETMTWELIVHPWCGYTHNKDTRVYGKLTPEVANKLAPLINDYIKHEYVAAKRLKKGVNAVTAVNRFIHLRQEHIDCPANELDNLNNRLSVSPVPKLRHEIALEESDNTSAVSAKVKLKELSSSTASISHINLAEGESRKRKKYSKNLSKVENSQGDEA